jgi:TetR/AcrR family transcriptional regulator
LEVAVEEFSIRGLAASRVDEIARRTESNKQLIYYYFDSKAGLYDAALARMVEAFREAGPFTDPKDEPEHDFTAYFDMVSSRAFRADNRAWNRLLAWEGIEHGAQKAASVHLEDTRTERYAANVAVIERALRDGALPAGVDPRALLLLMIYAVTLPDALPQITRMTMGQDAGDPELLERLRSTMRQLVVSRPQGDQS